MWEAFFFFFFFFFCSKTINVFENTLATTVNEFVINELIKLTMLWTTGPSTLFFVNIIRQTKSIFKKKKKKNNQKKKKKKKKKKK